MYLCNVYTECDVHSFKFHVQRRYGAQWWQCYKKVPEDLKQRAPIFNKKIRTMINQANMNHCYSKEDVSQIFCSLLIFNCNICHYTINFKGKISWVIYISNFIKSKYWFSILNLNSGCSYHNCKRKKFNEFLGENGDLFGFCFYDIKKTGLFPQDSCLKWIKLIWSMHESRFRSTCCSFWWFFDQFQRVCEQLQRFLGHLQQFVD